MAWWVTFCTPDPESEMDSVALVAVLTTETLPLKLPAAVGANVTVKLVVCPGAKVTGTTRPAALK